MADQLLTPRRVFVGHLAPIDVYIHVQDGQLLGADLVCKSEGISIECEVDMSLTNEDRIKGLLNGLVASLKSERYELACVVRDTLKALGIAPKVSE